MFEQPAHEEWFLIGFSRKVNGFGTARMAHKDFPDVTLTAADLPPMVASWLWSHRASTTSLALSLRQLYGVDPLPLITPPATPHR
jgi:hypothetical protein